MALSASNAPIDDMPYPQRKEILPRNLDAVTAPWLTSIMRNKYPGLEIKDLEIVELRNGHTTKMRVKLDLNAAGKAAGIPEHVCLKANWSGGFSEVDIHALEARFYYFARDVMKVPSAVGYFADWDGGPTGQGVVVMEDLVESGGTFGNSMDHLGVDGVAKACEAYARFHGASWGHPQLAQFDWLPTSMQTPIDCDQLSFMWPYVERNIAKEEYRSWLPRWLLDDPQNFHSIFNALSRYEQRQPGPYSIVHGDSHQGNSYVHSNGERIWVDWQLVRKGRPWRDLAYFMTGALTIEERRANERTLLAHYREHLIATGAQDVPSFDVIWESYRRWPIYGCQSWIANVDEWGQLGLPMTQRFFTALEDLDAVKLLMAEP